MGMFATVFLMSGIIIIPLSILAARRYYKNQKELQAARDVLNEKIEYYTDLTKEKLDQCPKEDLTTAVMTKILRVEQEDYDHVYENLNESERVLYAIYESVLAIDNGKGSIRKFFENDYYKPFIDMIDTAFEAIDCGEIADLMRACRYLQYIIDNDVPEEEEDQEILGDYSNYNFGDFTNEFMTLITSLHLNDKMTEYIDERRDDFIDVDIEEKAGEEVEEVENASE